MLIIYLCYVKTCLGQEDNFIYNCFVNDNLRAQLCRFKTSSHMLDIEIGRFPSIARDCRTCKLCLLNQTESQYHFLLCCPMYRCLRTKYFGYIHWP